MPGGGIIAVALQYLDGGLHHLEEGVGFFGFIQDWEENIPRASKDILILSSERIVLRDARRAE